MLDQQLTDEFSAGVSTAKAGNPILAKNHFHKVLQFGDPAMSVEAWIWLAWLSDSPAAAVHCLECAIAISPDNAIALQALAWNQHLANYQPTLNEELNSSIEPTTGTQLTHGPDTEPNKHNVTFDEPHNPLPEPSHLDAAWPTPSPEEPAEAAAIDDHRDERLQLDLPSLGWQRSTPEVEIASDRLTPSETCDWITKQLDEEVSAETSETAFDQLPQTEDGQDDPRLMDEHVPAWMPQRLQSEHPRQAEPQQEQPRTNWREQLRSQSQKRRADGHVDPEDELVERVDELTSFVKPIEPPTSFDTALDREAERQDVPEDTSFKQEFKQTTGNEPTVLIVDDSPTVRKLVTLTLEKHGYRVISACDGVAAIREMAAHVPSLVLLDINMPRLDGYKLCKLIKKHDATRGIPVVMLAGKDGMFDRLRGRLVGCSDYIAKPFDSETLLSKVHDYLPKSQPAVSPVDGVAVHT